MTNLAQRLAHSFSSLHRPHLLAVLAAGLLALAQHGGAQAPGAGVAPRISGEITSNERTTLPNSKNPRAQEQYDTGRLAGSTRLQGMSISFSRTEAQEATLKALLVAQQTPGSAQYHRWLTPDQFAAQFGLADADLAKVQSWLEQQGFSVDSVARSKNMIRFSGTAAQVESAFSTEMHSYKIPAGKTVVKHMAPSTALSVPSALAGVVLEVRGLDDFKPHSHATASHKGKVKPNFTQDYEGFEYVYFAPEDIATVYDINPEYKSSFTGAGQTITVVGQSEIYTSDLDAFWSASSITRQDPTLTLVPGTGDPTVVQGGDEAESDLDLEWAGAIAQGASLDFVYTGNSSNAGAFDSIIYAIDNQIGTIISSSYGDCEADLGGQTLESYLEQAASQGQTVMSAAGDDGSTDCFEDTDLSTAQEESLGVDYPASSPYVTGVGGTEISQANSAFETAPSAYWAAPTTTPTIVSSALQYIPEQAWNEDTAPSNEPSCLYYFEEGDGGSPICAGGGGASSLFQKPSWQTSVPGIPADNARDVPDLSLNAAIFNPGYLICTSDQSFWDTGDGQTSSCTSGFLDSTQTFTTGGGGTSFATPIFAGMLALINQQQGYTTGQGLINPTLYTLASNSATYASAFHDITTGSNACDASGYCSSQGESSYSAGVGYDQATGLGTVDLFNLAAAWPANSGTGSQLIGTTTAVSASSTAPNLNANDTFTITVAPVSGTGIPTGTVTITVDTNTPITGNTLTSNGTVTYTTSFSTTGAHTVLVAYSGDSTYAASSGSITVNVPVPVSGTGTFTMSATNLTVSQGSSGASTITITPAGGYTGTVDISFDTSNDNALENLCYEFTNTLSDGDGSVAVSSAAAVTTQLSFDTNAADCATAEAVARTGRHQLRTLHSTRANNHLPADHQQKPLAAGIALAGLLLAGFAGRSSRKLRGVACVLLLASIGLLATACGGGVASTTISDPSKGTYTVTLTGQDANTATINATTTFTFTID